MTAIPTMPPSGAAPHAPSQDAAPSAKPAGPALAALPSTPAKARLEQWLLALFIGVPILAVIAAIPVAWGWGLGWHDIVLAFAFYAISGHGITIGFHRYFTHGAFKAKRSLRVALAVAGSLALQGPVIRWVADHRRHHAFSDKDGDPHSPWGYGTGPVALIKGMWHAHMGWLFDPEQTNQQRFAPDLLADRDIRVVNKLFGPLTAVTLLGPALIGGLWSMSFAGAATALFWAGFVRVALLHHVTWSVNSICHTVGKRPFRSRDQSRNVWWLSVPSMGESWHNLHHADPTCARHGVDRGQLDSSARIIQAFEKLGLASDVRWPDMQRLHAKRA
jgi:stearoyl-CoA desaturase (delta-9 desaturase)